jgi:hypothetical protein
VEYTPQPMVLRKVWISSETAASPLAFAMMIGVLLVKLL